MFLSMKIYRPSDISLSGIPRTYLFRYVTAQDALSYAKDVFLNRTSVGSPVSAFMPIGAELW